MELARVLDPLRLHLQEQSPLAMSTPYLLRRGILERRDPRPEAISLERASDSQLLPTTGILPSIPLILWFGQSFSIVYLHRRNCN